MNFHLAQLNVARLLKPIEDPSIDEFRNNLDRINSLAESSPGFVWRYQEENGNATSAYLEGDPLLIPNLSVWENVEYLKQFTFQTVHVEFLRKRRLWFEKPTEAHMVLWWVEEGQFPDIHEAFARLKFLRKKGPSAKAFTFQKIFEPE